MTWMLILFLILNLSYSYADTLPKYSDEVHQTLFGDLASMEDVLAAAKYTLEWTPNDTQTKDANYEFWDDMGYGMMNFKDEISFTEPQELNIDSHDHASQQYHKLSKEIKVMRRQLAFNREDTDDNVKGIFGFERTKRWMARRCFLQFIIHTRHEVAKALIQREPLRGDKRYRMGYLFNRLRRIRTEELKLLYYVHDRNRHRSRPDHHWFKHYNVFWVEDSFMTHLMIYEKLTAHDVDLKDTIRLIKEIYSVKAPYDFVEEVHTLPTAKTVRPQQTAPPGFTTESQEDIINKKGKPGQGKASMPLQL